MDAIERDDAIRARAPTTDGLTDMPSTTQIIKRTYPREENLGGLEVTLRLMTKEDRTAIIKFASAQSATERAFLRMDICDPEVVDMWIENIEHGRTVTIIAEAKAGIIGYGSLHHNEVLWTSHIGEIRVFVAPEFRSNGIAQALLHELFSVAHGMRLERVVCQIPAEQDRVRVMFEEAGFQPEAILNDWIMSTDAKLHDLIVMSRYLNPFGG